MMEIQPASTPPQQPMTKNQQQKQTLKEMLEYPCSGDSRSFSSPRAVLDSPFDFYSSFCNKNSSSNSKFSTSSSPSSSSYAYADTISICTRFLPDRSDDSCDDDDEQVQNLASVSGRCNSPGTGTRAGIRCFTVFRRLSTFPSNHHHNGNYSTAAHRLLSFRKSSLKISKVTPLLSAAESKNTSSSSSSASTSTRWRHFCYSDIQAATNYFHPENLIGKGGYADVYKGRLPNDQLVAVKRLARGGKEEQGTSFLTELGVLGHICHPNTAALLGFCVEQGLFLVFEYFPYGSLATMLHGLQVMEWSARFKVAIGTAKGLHYLHANCRRRIIHRDIKASNILLGPNFEPQITDFGLAKWLPSEWTHHTVPVEGTFGYLAPEYFLHGIVDEKTDVFAFGVLLLELVTGLRPIDNNQKSLVMKVRPLLESGSFQQLIDSRLRGVYNVAEMQRTILAARLCIRQSAISRPSMGDVVKLLVEERADLNLASQSSSLWDKFGGDEDLLAHGGPGRDMSRYVALAFDSCLSPDAGLRG